MTASSVAVRPLVEPSILGEGTLSPIPAHNPNEFYRTSSGLFISGELRSRIVLHGTLVESPGAMTFDSRDFAGSAGSEEIGSFLPKGYSFSERELYGRAAQMLRWQLSGESGYLQTKARVVNVFCAADFKMAAFWMPTHHWWNLSVWHGEWHSGPLRVFRFQSSVR